MPRRNRLDEPGSHHHVMNRAIARRPLFETRRDMRFFLSLLAREVRRGMIRVFSYCLMTTHFHVYLESTTGQLAASMQKIQTTYSRYFNRGRRRDGPLFRGRFMSKRVDTFGYRRVLTKYIEANPIQANLVDYVVDYEFSSGFYRKGRRVPRWLFIESTVGVDEESPTAKYDEIAFLIEGRLNSPGSNHDIDSLVLDCPERVFAWMIQKSLLADGTAPMQPVCSPRCVLEAVELHRNEIASLAKRPGPDADALVRHMTVGLLRLLCGARFGDIASVMQRSHSAAAASWSRFVQLREEIAEVDQLAARITAVALERGPLGQIGLLEVT